MSEFLRQVAQHYYTDDSIGRLCFVFPNKRSIVFFKHYLSEEAKKARRTSLAPRCITINELFYSLTKRPTTDRIHLLAELYEVYSKLNAQAESFDDFIYWGGVLLSDFDDVDKYLANPKHIFTNIAELKGMQDDFSYLTENQRDAIRHFLSLFEKDGSYKAEFRKIWDILLPLYTGFNERLRQKGLSYEGMVYRELAEDETPIADRLKARFPYTQKYVFTGLNALNECERKLLGKMHKAGLAEFNWDFSSREITDPQNRSSHFLGELSKIFPQAFKLDPEGLGKPSIHTISVPSSVGQAKQIPGILSKLGDSIGIETAIVLPDEGLLVPTLNSIPESIKKINVTMGYPMKGSGFHALMIDIALLQTNLTEKEDGIYFYHRQVWSIFSNGLFTSILSEDEKARVDAVRTEAKYFIPQKDLAVGEVMSLIFREASDIATYERELVLGLAPLLKDNPLELEFAKTWLQTLTSLESLGLELKPSTWYNLLLQISEGTSVPFTGEPLEGLQIMGPLETRALDFKNVIILSCNEGIFPRHNVASSFIPAEIRKGFELPTYEHQDAVWAYYFYRLIQRAENVWMVFDSRAEVSRSGEESRYIKQLEMLYGYTNERFVMKASSERSTLEAPIPKTQEHIDKMHSNEFHLSATALQNYLTCPAKFFYGSIEGLGAPDEVAESLDAGMQGSVLHNSMRALYSKYKGSYNGKEKFEPIAQISADYIKGLLKDEKKLRSVIDHYITEQMGVSEITGKNLVYRELILSYVKQILSTDLELLKDKKYFNCLGLEEFAHQEIGGFDFVGYIDRIDSFDDGSVRIVDYKTGKVEDKDIKIDAANYDKVVEALFGEDNAKRPKIALQLYLYDVLLKDDPRIRGKQIINCIYQTNSLLTKGAFSCPKCEEFCSQTGERLEGLLRELDNPEGYWERKGDERSCSWCDFKTLCGK